MSRKKNNSIIAITFVLILITGILFKQAFYRMLPLFVSLFVMTLQSKINRYGFLLGSANCVLYTIVYLYLGLYASIASTVLFSLPIQLITFFNWKKRSYHYAVMLKKMSIKLRIGTGIAFAVVWAVTFAILSFTNANCAILDNTASLLGILVSFLTMLAYVEYAYLGVVNSILGIFLNLQVMASDPSHITYVIYAFFALYCVILGAINVNKLYRKQQEEEFDS